MSFLKLEGLSKRYGATEALSSIHLTVPAGSRTAIVGPSGSGKSTLLRLVAGFEAPDRGRIILDEAVLVEDGAEPLAAHRRDIGIVSQDGALFPHLTVAENVGFGLARTLPDRTARIAALMDMVELDQAMLARRPHEISGGQQQRVALARALARQPKLMLLDEPFSALDAALRETMREAVAGVLARAGITALLVTHDQAEALSFADQVAVLREGRLIQAGAPTDLYHRPVDPVTALFLGDALILPAQAGEGFADCALGRLATGAGPLRGDARLMLRPEQLVIGPMEGADLVGEVAGIEFGGALCTAILALPSGIGDPRGGPSRIRVRCASIDLPAVGARVGVSVRGQAHVFPPLDPAAVPDLRTIAAVRQSR